MNSLNVNKIVGVFTIFKDDVRQPDFLHFHVVFGTVVFFSSCSARRQTSKSSTFPPHIKKVTYARQQAAFAASEQALAWGL